MLAPAAGGALPREEASLPYCLSSLPPYNNNVLTRDTELSSHTLRKESVEEASLAEVDTQRCGAWGELLRVSISSHILWEWMTKTHLERWGAHFERSISTRKEKKM